MINAFMVIDNMLHYSIISGWDEQMEEEKKKNTIPDDIPIIWVNVVQFLLFLSLNYRLILMLFKFYCYIFKCSFCNLSFFKNLFLKIKYPVYTKSFSRYYIQVSRSFCSVAVISERPNAPWIQFSIIFLYHSKSISFVFFKSSIGYI